MPIVDYWVLVDNVVTPPQKIACGKYTDIQIIDSHKFNLIKTLGYGKY